ncbi:MAG: hypothetical protein ABI134_01195 [Byssovorax sp.]
MNLALDLHSGIREIGTALRRPEEFVLRFRDSDDKARKSLTLFPILFANAVLGLAVYGLTMGLHGGARSMIRAAVRAPIAAGAGWTIALPALYIINTVLGSRLDARTTTLAALTTVSFGALAMLASVPINWFFGITLPYAPIALLVNLVIFAGVSVSMVDVFLRIMKALEPDRSRLFALVWLGLVAVIGGELMILLEVFSF